MRKVIAGAFVSLDGVMQAPGGPEEDPTGGFKHGGWTVPYFDEAVGQAMGETFSRPFDLLLGRKTYEIFAAHWPYAEGGPDDFIARLFNKATKYVATTSSAPLTWTPSVAIHEPATDVARLKRQDGPDLLIQGSSVLIQTLLENDLIDQMNLLVFPLVLGSGKRFFGDGAKAMAVSLESSKTSPSGVTINRYTPAGSVTTGSFALQTPTEAELVRREKMKQEV
ncbi:MAG: dihydrofolate reductase family protein [Vicinamibacterales bacterium]